MMPAQLRVVDAASAAAQRALSQYFQELSVRLPRGFDAGTALDSAAVSYNPPHGAFVIAGALAEPLGCGAVNFLDDSRAEVKRIWVSPAARGTGLAARILGRLEQLSAAAGRRLMVLDTSAVLTEAVRLYRRCGYAEVPPYNDNPNADFWFAKEIAAGAPSGT